MMDPIYISAVHATTGIPLENPVLLFTPPEDGIYKMTVVGCMEGERVEGTEVDIFTTEMTQGNGDTLAYLGGTLNYHDPEDTSCQIPVYDQEVWLRGGVAVYYSIHNSLDKSQNNLGTYSAWCMITEVMATPGWTE